jgi:hypothetical protein
MAQSPILIYDKFTGPNGDTLAAHTPGPINIPGGSWSATDYRIDSNKAYNNTTSNRAVGIPTGRTDLYRVTATFTTNINSGVALRVVDATHSFFTYNTATNFLIIEDNGGFTQRASMALVPSGVGKASIELNGNVITAKHYSDNVLDGVLTYTSALFAASQNAGLALQQGTTHAADEFVVETI